jgi:uracil-DNA glycosylase
MTRIIGEQQSDLRDEISWVVMPLYHPAAALYNGSMRKTLMDDFSKLPEIINKFDIQ